MQVKKGFTLVELLVVIALIGLLTVIAVLSSIAISNKVKKKMLDTKIDLIESSAIVWGQNNKTTIEESASECSDKLKNDTSVTSCISIPLSKLINDNYLKEDETREGNKVLINPVNNEILNDCNVYVYIKNKRVYAEYDNSGENCGYTKKEEDDDTQETPKENDETTKPTTTSKPTTEDKDKITVSLNYGSATEEYDLLSSEYLFGKYGESWVSVYLDDLSRFSNLNFEDKQSLIRKFTEKSDTGPNIKDGNNKILSNPYDDPDDWDVNIEWTLCNNSNDDKCIQENIIGYWIYTYKYKGKEYELDNNTIYLKTYLKDIDGPVIIKNYSTLYDGSTINMNNVNNTEWYNTFDNWDGIQDFDLENYIQQKEYSEKLDLELVDSHYQTRTTTLNIGYVISGELYYNSPFKYNTDLVPYLTISSSNSCVTFDSSMISIDTVGYGYESAGYRAYISGPVSGYLSKEGLCLTADNYDISVEGYLGNIYNLWTVYNDTSFKVVSEHVSDSYHDCLDDSQCKEDWLKSHSDPGDTSDAAALYGQYAAACASDPNCNP